jgi:hypothetical protein
MLFLGPDILVWGEGEGGVVIMLHEMRVEINSSTTTFPGSIH